MMNRRFGHILATLTALGAALAGCASTYEGPASGPTATLTVPRNQWKVFSSQGIQIALKGTDGCGTFMNLPDPGSENAARLNLIGGADYILTFHAAQDGGTCVITGAFTAEAGKHYEAQFEAGSGVCLAGLMEVSPAERRPVKLRPAQRDTMTGRTACER